MPRSEFWRLRSDLWVVEAILGALEELENLGLGSSKVGNHRRWHALAEEIERLKEEEIRWDSGTHFGVDVSAHVNPGKPRSHSWRLVLLFSWPPPLRQESQTFPLKPQRGGCPRKQDRPMRIPPGHVANLRGCGHPTLPEVFGLAPDPSLKPPKPPLNQP